MGRLFLVMFDEFDSLVLGVRPLYCFGNWDVPMVSGYLSAIFYVNFVTCVLFCKIKFISCAEIKTYSNETVKDGFAKTLGIWPMRFRPQNMVVSTFPLRLALNKLAAVAEGEAKKELLTSLGVTDVKTLSKFYPRLDSKLQCLRDSDLIMLNKFYVNYTDYIAPSFLADSYKNFGVHIDKLYFFKPNGVVTFVNQWVETATYKRITGLLKEEDVRPRHNMLLINALHMKITWEFPFDIRLSVIKPFKLHNKKDTVDIRMMSATDKLFHYYRCSEHSFQVLMVHLFCEGCKITYFLPHELSGLPNLLQMIAEQSDVIKNAVKNMKQESLNVQLPVMKIKTLMNWTPYLQGIGIKKIFDRHTSGLEAMSLSNPRHKYFLGSAIQKAFIEIDEFGIRREKPDFPLDIMPQMENYRRTPQFIADHPFYFKIEIEDDGISHELFSGVFYGQD